MSGLTHGSRIRHLVPDRTTVLGLLLLVGFELLLTGTYVAVSGVRITNPLILIYPFIWIDVSLLAVITTDPNPENTRQRLVALGIAAGYFLVLGYFGGLYGLGMGWSHSTSIGTYRQGIARRCSTMARFCGSSSNPTRSLDTSPLRTSCTQPW